MKENKNKEELTLDLAQKYLIISTSTNASSHREGRTVIFEDDLKVGSRAHWTYVESDGEKSNDLKYGRCITTEMMSIKVDGKLILIETQNTVYVFEEI